MIVERMNRTEGEVLAHQAKTREEMRQYRKENKDEIKACLEKKKRCSAMSHLQTKKVLCQAEAGEPQAKAHCS